MAIADGFLELSEKREQADYDHEAVFPRADTLAALPPDLPARKVRSHWAAFEKPRRRNTTRSHCSARRRRR